MTSDAAYPTTGSPGAGQTLIEADVIGGGAALAGPVAAARAYASGRRVAPPHRMPDPRHRPLFAVRLSVLTRKILGGLPTDLQSRVLDDSGAPVTGFFAAGETPGFGGGGTHGCRAIEGTFPGGCLFSGRAAGQAAASEV